MPDIIKLLPESVANQIAAGEVIQRPASAVKELLENAIDAGATEIKLYIKDSGRALIQIVDNGCGMSLTDARLAFERHATSKIREAADLFAIRSLGFRGEALASIASVAQVQLKSRRQEDDLGTLVEIEGAVFKNQSPVACPTGTSIAVKNLFFNVPARRNFLKSNNAEFRHIIEEFQRVALVYHETGFSLFNSDKPMFALQRASLKQRIVALMGNHFSNRLIPINETAPEVGISGLLGKPEFSRKTRGEQFFFVNKRFIRNPYLHHAVDTAYKELIPDDSHPVYFIYLEVDPTTIDINIHPTKTEVNFQHNQLIYATLKAAVKKALGKFSLAPALDFDREQSINIPTMPADYVPKQPQIKLDPDYSPFRQGHAAPQQASGKPVDEHWQQLYKPETPSQSAMLLRTEQDFTEAGKEDPALLPESSQLMQVNGRYILARVRSGLMIIDQHYAHQRILYDKLMESLTNKHPGSQQNMFPQTVNFSPANADILREIYPQLQLLGFVIEPLGISAFVVSGMPADMDNNNPAELLEKIIDNYKRNLVDLKSDKKTSLARSMARQLAIKPGKALGNEEMFNIVNELFASKAPETAPDGSPTLRILTIAEIGKLFRE
jgi:DNA mismatch repair protein MutL